MTRAERTALIVRAKKIATPAVSCVRAGIRYDHLTAGLTLEGVLALVTVLAESASLERLKAITDAPGDEGMPLVTRQDMLKAVHAEYSRLIRAGQPVPGRIRILNSEYRRGNKQRLAEARAAATEAEQGLAA